MIIELHLLIGSPVHCQLFTLKIQSTVLWRRIPSPITLPFDFPSRLKTTWPGWVSGCVALSTLLLATLKGTHSLQRMKAHGPIYLFPP